MRVVAIGRTENLYESIMKIRGAGHDIILIISCKESPGYRVTTNDFKLLAKKIGVGFIETERINSPEVKNIIKESKPDIGIGFNWKTIISVI